VAVAGPAFAQSASEPVKLGFGGYWNSAYGDLISQSGSAKSGRRTDDIDTDAVIAVKGSTKFDNGLTAGVSVQFRGENLTPSAASSPGLTAAQPDTIKRSYGYIGSDFGQIRIGDDDDARRQKAMTAPVAGGGQLFGADTPDMQFSNGGPGTNTTMKTMDTTKRVSRVAYFSPTIAGFSFAASYAPGGEKGGIGETGGTGTATTPTNGVNAINNSISAAVGYSGKFSDISLDAYFGVSSGHRVRSAPVGASMTGRDNPFAAGGGGVIGFGPFKFGGAYEYLYDRDLALNTATVSSGHQNRKTWDIGPEFIAGPFSVSVDWSRAILQNVEVNASGYQDVISLAGDYVLGPGVDVGAAIDFVHYHTNGGATNQANIGGSYTGVALMTGIGFNF
jgi:predicted porin